MGDAERIAETRASLDAMRKPERPDPSQVQLQTQKLTATIEQYAARIQDIKEKTAHRRGSRHERSPEERELLDALHKIQNERQRAWVSSISVNLSLAEASVCVSEKSSPFAML